MWLIRPQKHENVFYESLESESALFCILPPPGHLCGPYFKVTARTNNGNPTVLFSQCCKPHLWKVGKKMCLNCTIFRYSARSPHRATKASRGWLRVVIRKPRLVLSELHRAGNKVTARARAYCRGCVAGALPYDRKPALGNSAESFWGAWWRMPIGHGRRRENRTGAC